MQFANKITLIKPGDKVLEVGPGSLPYFRSDVFLDIVVEDENEAFYQRGGEPELSEIKSKTVYYDGKTFPFRDKEFDYVVCSHVLEHVENVPEFLSEIFRVSNRGYFEYPTIYYDYLYNIPVHKNFLKMQSGKIFSFKKSESSLDSFKCVQKLFYESLVKGYVDIVTDLKEFMFEGFQWESPFELVETHNLNDVLWGENVLSHKDDKQKYKVARYIRKMKNIIFLRN